MRAARRAIHELFVELAEWLRVTTLRTIRLSVGIAAGPNDARALVQQKVVRLILADDEILVPIVVRVVVDVMHDRAFRKRLPERTFRDELVLIDVTC